MKKLLLGILLTIGLIASAFGLIACGETPQEKSEIEKIYDSYVTYSNSQGVTAMTYSDWLATIKGKDGRDGINGQDGLSAYELYKKYHTDYIKTEQEFLDDLVNDRLGKNENEQGLAFYLQDDGTYSVGIGNAEELSKIVIPATYNGKAVTKIKNNFANSLNGNQTLKEVAIPNSIKTIGDRAFYRCTSLTSVTIGDSVESIGWYAFCGCSSLIKVNYLGDIDSWCEIEFSNDSYEECSSNPLYYAKNLYINDELVTGANITKATNINAYAFYNCCSLTSITIPNSVKSIENYAFCGCETLTKVNYLGDIDSWCEIEFNCSQSNPLYYAKNLYINDELVTEANITKATKINSDAFSGCSSLTSVTIGDSVKEIGEYAFSSCSSLTKVNYLGDIDSWCEIEFSDYSSNPLYYAENLYINGELVTEANITKATKINGDAFKYCSSLTSVTIGDKVESIGNYAFRYCSSLKSVTIGDSVKSIGWEAFENCSSLTSITIGNSVESIGYYAFYDCSSLKSVTIGDSVESIGDYAFYGCSSLTSITIGDSVESIGYGAFCGCDSLEEMTIPFVGAILNDTENTHLGYIFGSGDIYYCPVPNSLKKVIITGGNSIGYGAFCLCSSLTSITIPNSVTSIGCDAFYNCSSLTSITIPDSVTSIGSHAFYNCSKLTSITFSGSINWYRLNSYYDNSNDNWHNKTGGTLTYLSNASTNATYFKSTYYNYYWYKLDN